MDVSEIQTRPQPQPALDDTHSAFFSISCFLASGTPHSGARSPVALTERKVGLRTYHMLAPRANLDISTFEPHPGQPVVLPEQSTHGTR